MVAFRNTGIEGGAVSLATQNWLLRQRRFDTRCSKITGEKTPQYHRTGKSDYGPARPLPVNVPMRCRAALIEYVDGKFEPSKHGGAGVNRKLHELGLIQSVTAPYRWASQMEFGDTYLPTKAGREYVEALRNVLRVTKSNML